MISFAYVFIVIVMIFENLDFTKYCKGKGLAQYLI